MKVFDELRARAAGRSVPILSRSERSVPALILHGDDDQIVPIAGSSLLSANIVKNAMLKVYNGAPHRMALTLKNQINADLLAFFGEKKQAAA